jgi:hypothetical protein
LYTFELRAVIATIFGPKMVAISAYAIQKNTKFANFARLYFPHILQHFATKLCNFTHFSMLFPGIYFFWPRPKIKKLVAI